MQRACLARMKPWVQSLALHEIELIGTALSSRHLGSGGRNIRSSKVIFSYVLRSRAPWDTLDHRLSQQEKKKKIITLIVYICVLRCACVYRTENTFGCCFSGTVHLSSLNYTLLVCLFCLCAHVHDMVHVWRSENNSLTSVLSSHCVGPRD